MMWDTYYAGTDGGDGLKSIVLFLRLEVHLTSSI